MTAAATKPRQWEHLVQGPGRCLGVTALGPAVTVQQGFLRPPTSQLAPGLWLTHCLEDTDINLQWSSCPTELPSRNLGDYLFRPLESSVRFPPQMQEVHVLFLFDILCHTRALDEA